MVTFLKYKYKADQNAIFTMLMLVQDINERETQMCNGETKSIRYTKTALCYRKVDCVAFNSAI